MVDFAKDIQPIIDSRVRMKRVSSSNPTLIKTCMVCTAYLDRRGHLPSCPIGKLAAIGQRIAQEKEQKPKQTNPCPVCGTFLWNDPRPCWNCRRMEAALAEPEGSPRLP